MRFPRVYYWAAAAAVLAFAAVGYFVYSSRAAPTPSSSLPDVFDSAFGVSGIYESPKK